ncbi:MAG TPA: hypothetical protein VFU15_16985 [Bacteroidia bacterium]|nr:hypothetical protein [Bacteroidia bacterium]
MAKHVSTKQFFTPFRALLTGGRADFSDAEGQLIFGAQLSHPGEVLLPQDNPADGIYMVRFTTSSGGIYSGKIIIQKN